MAASSSGAKNGLPTAPTAVPAGNTLIKQVESRLSIQRKRRESMIRQSRDDIAQLLQKRKIQTALSRVGQLYKDQCLLSVYDQIEQFCGCIATNLPLIRNHCSSLESLPGDVSEAVSSLVFAASRRGELPELNSMVCLLRKYFGYLFETANVELNQGNLVNSKMKQKLCIRSVPDDQKLKLVKEIAQEHNLQLGIQDSEHFDEVFRLSYLIRNLEEKSGVLDMELQDCHGDDNDVSEHKATKKLGSNYSMSYNKDFGIIPGYSRAYSNRVGGSNSSNQVKENAVQLDKQEVFSAALKSSNRKYAPFGDINCKVFFKDGRSLDGSIDKLGKQNRRCSYSGDVHPKLPDFEDARGKLTHGKVGLFKDCCSLDTSIAELKKRNGSPGHVHPKLPHYEDVLAKLTHLKAEYKRQLQLPRFSYF